MNFFVIMAGLLLGAYLLHEPYGGALFGALLAWLLKEQRALKRQLRALQQVQAAPPVVTARTDRGDDAPADIAPHLLDEPETARDHTMETMAMAVPAAYAPSADAPPTTSQDSVASAVPSWLHRGWTWFSTGNVVAKVGVLLLFMGVTFLLKYAAGRYQLPVEGRYFGAGGLAIALLTLGWRLRGSNGQFALLLQGGAVALFYLTLFAALRLHNLLPPTLTFALLTVVAVAAAVLAVAQAALSLAVIGVCGGFLAPLLTSTGHGDHVTLFSYYLLLNVGIVLTGRFHAWRLLNLLGFIFTFAIASAWGVLSYRAEQFNSTEPFLLLFFAFYLRLTWQFAQQRAAQAGAPYYVDSTISFGLPIIAFGLQVGLVEPWRYGAAFSALGYAAVYLLLAMRLLRQRRLPLLMETWFAIGVVFATVAIPLALDARWTASTWGLEAAGALWLGLRQQRLPSRLFAYLLLFAAGASLLLSLDQGIDSWLNGVNLSALLLLLGSLLAAITLARQRAQAHPKEQGLPAILAGWGIACWLLANDHAITALLPPVQRAMAWLISQAMLALLLERLASRSGWTALARPLLLHAPLAALLLLGQSGQPVIAQPFSQLGQWAWPLWFAMQGWLAYRGEQLAADDSWLRHSQRWQYAAWGWLSLLLAAWCSSWLLAQLGDAGSSWRVVGWVLPLLWLLAQNQHWPTRWPFQQQRIVFQDWLPLPIAGLVYGWLILVNVNDAGIAEPLPYLPLLNPIDLASAGGLMLLWRWRQQPFVQQQLRQAPPALASRMPFALAAWLWLSCILLRSFYHWDDVPYRLHSWLQAPALQTGLSLLWSTLALASMATATRFGNRHGWLGGALLLAIVVGKLFLLDLTRVGSLERVISFIGVGLLMLLIGYLAPLPAKADKS